MRVSFLLSWPPSKLTRPPNPGIFEEDCPDFAKIIKLMREKGRDSTRLFMYAQRVDAATVKLYHQELPSQELRL